MPKPLLLTLGGLIVITFATLGVTYQSPAQRTTTAAWKVICANAPHGAGQEIGQQEQRAMTTLNLWHTSVEDVDAKCR